MAALAAICFGVAGLLVGLHAMASYLASKGDKEIVVGEGKDAKKIEIETLKKHSVIWGTVACVLGILFLVIGGGDDNGTV